jgi:hypothetical protein
VSRFSNLLLDTCREAGRAKLIIGCSMKNANEESNITITSEPLAFDKKLEVVVIIDHSIRAHDKTGPLRREFFACLNAIFNVLRMASVKLQWSVNILDSAANIKPTKIMFADAFSKPARTRIKLRAQSLTLSFGFSPRCPYSDSPYGYRSCSRSWPCCVWI